MATRSLNLVQLIGNLTKDPEVRYTGNGTPVASFSIATNRNWKNQEGNIEESVEFHSIVAWGKLGEICGQYLKKGTKVYVQGSLNTRSWQDDAGVTKYKTEVRADEMIILDSKGGRVDEESVSTTDDVQESPVQENSSEEDPLKDLPF